MASINQIKYLRSLHKSKFRIINKQYLVEGEKLVQEALKSDVNVDSIYATSDWIANNTDVEPAIIETSNKDLQKIGQLSTANQVIAVVDMDNEVNNTELTRSKWYLALESVRDPGNMGTIIRTADWFGIDEIFLSPDCVDIYNAKVIQSTMGSLFRVKISSMDFSNILSAFSEKDMPIYGAALDGEDMYKMTDVRPGLLVFGN